MSTAPPAHLNYQMASVIVNESAVSSLDFHKSGTFLVSATRESSIHLVDCMTGLERKKLFARSNGIGQVKFTHHESCILMSAAMKANDIRYMCMHDNVVLRVFKTQEHDRVSSLSMNPIDDRFLSASSKSVMLWTLGVPTAIGKLQLPSYSDQVSVAYDSAGAVFGVSCLDGNTRNRSIKLYDVRNFEAGPFLDLAPSADKIATALGTAAAAAVATAAAAAAAAAATAANGASAVPATVPPQSQLLAQAQRILQSAWTGFEFSADGFHILVNTAESLIVIDAFKEDVPPVVIPKKNEGGMSLGACLSADAKWVLSGTDDNELAIYDKTTGALCNTLTGHVAPIGCIKCNPRFDMWASGCVNTALWLRNGNNIAGGSSSS